MIKKIDLKLKLLLSALLLSSLQGCMTMRFLESSKEHAMKDPIAEVILLPYQAGGVISNALLDAATLNGSLLGTAKERAANPCARDIENCYTWWNVLK